MEFVKKLLVLAAIPVSVLAMENESEEGSILRKPLDQNLKVRSFYNDTEYKQNMMRALGRLKNTGNTIDITEIETWILAKELDSKPPTFNHFKNHISKAKFRSFGFGGLIGGLTGILLTNAYMTVKSILNFYKTK